MDLYAFLKNKYIMNLNERTIAKVWKANLGKDP